MPKDVYHMSIPPRSDSTMARRLPFWVPFLHMISTCCTSMSSKSFVVTHVCGGLSVCSRSADREMTLPGPKGTGLISCGTDPGACCPSANCAGPNTGTGKDDPLGACCDGASSQLP